MVSATHSDFFETLLDDEINHIPEVTPKKNRLLPSIWDTGYRPDMAPTQLEVFESQKDIVLTFGERGSGKTGGMLHKGIAHAYEEKNAFALLITKISRQGEAGLADEMTRNYLPVWAKDIGLEYIPFKINPTTKDVIGWIGNRHNGWSKIQLMSIPHAKQTAARMKGMSPSFIGIDEISEFDSKDVVTYTIQQLRRRSGIAGPQQLYGTTNPTGDDTWVFDLYFYDSVDDEGNPLDNWDVFHMPFSENRFLGDPDAYIRTIAQMYRHDPIMFARMVEGKWIAQPVNDSFFGRLLDDQFHIRGNLNAGKILKPVKNFPIIVGMDPGTRWTSVSYMQLLPIQGVHTWVVFDEVIFQKRHDYKTLTLSMERTMNFWNEMLEHDFSYIHISDDSATTMWRPGEGSFDAKVIEEHSDGRIKILGCPKGAGSVRSRIAIMQTALLDKKVIFSAKCKNHILMLRGLEADEKDPNKPKRSKHLHTFDSCTYPMYYYSFMDFTPGMKPDLITA